jgi:hypothetical protein
MIQIAGGLDITAPTYLRDTIDPEQLRVNFVNMELMRDKGSSTLYDTFDDALIIRFPRSFVDIEWYEAREQKVLEFYLNFP